jgi:hypothetical protein
MRSYEIQKTAMNLAHLIKSQFDTFGEALSKAWKIAKVCLGYTDEITFVKGDDSIRTAKVERILLKSYKNGCMKFIEKIGNDTQFRAFRVEKIK